jgi:hypothetical protein
MFVSSGNFLCVVWRVHLLCFTDTFPFIVAFCSLKVFTFAGIVGTLFLLPINYMGTEIRDNSEFQNKSLDSFSISNVNNGSHGWVPPEWKRIFWHDCQEWFISVMHLYYGILIYYLLFYLHKCYWNLIPFM